MSWSQWGLIYVTVGIFASLAFMKSGGLDRSSLNPQQRKIAPIFIAIIWPVFLVFYMITSTFGPMERWHLRQIIKDWISRLEDMKKRGKQ